LVADGTAQTARRKLVSPISKPSETDAGFDAIFGSVRSNLRNVPVKAYLPYVYNMAYVPPKRVKSVLARIGGTIEVDVPEISRTETGLAATFDYHLPRQGGNIISPMQFRSWNGNLLAPAWDENNQEFHASWLPSVPGERSEGASAFRSLYGCSFHDDDDMVKYARGDVAGATDYQEPPPGRIEWSHRDRVYSTVKRLADNLVSVDGKLWRKTGFAALCLDTRQNDDKPLWASIIQTPFGFLPFTKDSSDERRSYPYRKLFNVSEVDRLKRHAGDAGVYLHYKSLVIHDASALTFDGEQEFIRQAMDFAVLTIEKSVGELSTRGVLAWNELRAAVERVGATSGESLTDSEIEAFRHLAEEYRGEQCNLVRGALEECEEYLNDPWGRYGSQDGPKKSPAELPRP
jgi:hypothetical protein